MKYSKGYSFIEISDKIIKQRMELLFEDKYLIKDKISYFLVSEYGDDNIENLLDIYDKKDIELSVENHLKEELSVYLEWTPKISEESEDKKEDSEKEIEVEEELSDDIELNLECKIGKYDPKKLPEAIKYIEENKDSKDKDVLESAKTVFYVFTYKYVHSEVGKALLRDPALRTKMKKLAKSPEDIENDIYIDAFAKFSTYKSEAGVLTTFIKPFLEKNIHEIRYGKLKQNYGKAAQKCNAVSATWHNKNLGIPTFLDYYIETKIPVTTLYRTFEAAPMVNDVSLEATIEESGEVREYVRDTTSEFYMNPESAFLKSETTNNLKNAILRLKSPYKEVFILKHAEDISESEFFIKDKDLKLAKQCDENAKKVMIHEMLKIPMEKVDEYYNEAINMLREDSKFLNSFGMTEFIEKDVKDVALFDSFSIAQADFEALLEEDIAKGNKIVTENK